MKEMFQEEKGYIVGNCLYQGVHPTDSTITKVGYRVFSKDHVFQGLLDQNRIALWYVREDSLVNVKTSE